MPDSILSSVTGADDRLIGGEPRRPKPGDRRKPIVLRPVSGIGRRTGRPAGTRPGVWLRQSVVTMATPLRDPFRLPIRLANGAILVERGLCLTMRDGVRLSAAVYRPARPGPVPGLLEQLPYRKDDLRMATDRAVGAYLAARGIAYVRLDVRGTGGSEGIATDEYTEAEQLDGCEAVAWIASQPWSNGRVGAWGVSYGATAALLLAARRPPALGAVAAVSGADDRFDADCHYVGGAVSALELARYPVRMLALNALPPSPQPGMTRLALLEWWRERAERTPLWLEAWLAEPPEAPYWRTGSIRPSYERIECPVMLASGWRDGYRAATVRTATSLSAPWQLTLGPWGHALPDWGTPGPPYPFLDELVAWFGEHLGAARPTARAPRPRTVFFLGDLSSSRRADVRERWLASDGWPAVESPEQRLYLLASGELARDTADGPAFLPVPAVPAPGLGAGKWCPPAGARALPGDQRFDESRSLCFTSRPLRRELCCLGTPRLTLRLRGEPPPALLSAKLCAVAPGGRSTLVTRGLVQLARAVGPGNVLQLELDPIAWRFHPGQLLRLALAANDWPLAWPLAGGGPRVLLELAGGAPPELVLPGLPSDAAPFEPAGEIAYPSPEGVSFGRHRPTWRTLAGAGAGQVSGSDGFSFAVPGDGIAGVERRRYRATLPDRSTLGARVHGECSIVLDRPDVSAAVSARVSVSASADSFLLDASLDVDADGVPLVRRRLQREIARNDSLTPSARKERDHAA